jgi:hypothetical protein
MIMADTREHMAETNPQPGSVVRDLKRLKSDGSASVAELRQFLQQMKGKSPQAMLGLVAKSGLARSTALATFLFAVVLVTLTVVPYALRDRTAKPSETAASEKPAAESAGRKPAAEIPGPEPAAAAAATADDAGKTPPVSDRALEALGIGETKTADPKKNPLEDKLNNLLDGVE